MSHVTSCLFVLVAANHVTIAGKDQVLKKHLTLDKPPFEPYYDCISVSISKLSMLLMSLCKY